MSHRCKLPEVHLRVSKGLVISNSKMDLLDNDLSETETTLCLIVHQEVSRQFNCEVAMQSTGIAQHE